MKQKTITAFLIAISLVLLTSCLEKAPITIKNNLSDRYIVCLYISHSSDSIWGSNRLPNSNVLLSGRESETMVIPGSYDIQVTDSNGNTYSLTNIQVTSSGFIWEVTEECVDTLTDSLPHNLQYAGTSPVVFTSALVNNRINGIWIALSADNNWGENHIPGYFLNPGDCYTAYLQPDTYDLYVEDETGKCSYKWSTTVTQDGYTWNITEKEMHFE